MYQYPSWSNLTHGGVQRSRSGHIRIFFYCPDLGLLPLIVENWFFFVDKIYSSLSPLQTAALALFFHCFSAVGILARQFSRYFLRPQVLQFILFAALLGGGGGGCGGGTRGSGFEVRGTLTNAVSGLRLANIELVVAGTGESVVTNDSGEFQIETEFPGESIELLVRGQGINTSVVIGDIPLGSESIEVELFFNPGDGTVTVGSPNDSDDNAAEREDPIGTGSDPLNPITPTLPPAQPQPTPTPVPQPPSSPSVSPIPALVNTAAIVLSGAKDPGSGIAVNGTLLVPADALASWSIQVTLNEGLNVFTITSVAANGLSSGAVVATTVLDTIAPVAPSIQGQMQQTAATSVTVSGSKESGASVIIDNVLSVAADSSTSWSAVVVLAVEGANAFSFRSADSAGNLSSETLLNIVRDTASPVITDISAGALSQTGVTLNVAAAENVSLAVTYDVLGGTNPTTVLSSVFQTQHTIVLSGLQSDTTYQYLVVADDTVGNNSVVNNLGFTTLAFNFVGDGTFGAPLPLPLSTGKQEAAVGDFNNDGNLDVVELHHFTANIRVLLGNGDGTMQAAGPETISLDGAFSMRSGDFNNDGNLDIGFILSDFPQFGIMLGNGDGTFQAASVNSLPFITTAMDFADLDGDGNLDLVAAALAPQEAVYTALGLGTGAFSGAVNTPRSFPRGETVTLRAVDINADGIPDLISFEDVGLVRVYLGSGDGTFGVDSTYSTQEPVTIKNSRFAMSLVDMNGDSHMDIIVGTGGSENGHLEVFLGDSSGVFAPVIASPTLSNFGNTDSTDIGDFNADGIIDLAAISSVDDRTVQIFTGAADGSFVNTSQTAFATSAPGLDSIAVGDFNNDMILDLIVNHSQDTEQHNGSILLGNAVAVP